MFDKMLRPLKERILIPISSIIGRCISPNLMTLISLILGIISAIFIILGYIKLALIFWLLNRVTDGLDGTIARVTNNQTDFGGYLDIMVDFFIYALIPISFVIYKDINVTELFVVTIMLGIFYINGASWMYLSSILEKRNQSSSIKLTSINMPSGLIEGFETIIIYSCFFIFTEKILILYLVMIILTSIGIAQRITWAIKNI